MGQAAAAGGRLVRFPAGAPVITELPLQKSALSFLLQCTIPLRLWNVFNDIIQLYTDKTCKNHRLSLVSFRTIRSPWRVQHLQSRLERLPESESAVLDLRHRSFERMGRCHIRYPGWGEGQEYEEGHDEDRDEEEHRRWRRERRQYERQHQDRNSQQGQGRRRPWTKISDHVKVNLYSIRLPGIQYTIQSRLLRASTSSRCITQVTLLPSAS